MPIRRSPAFRRRTRAIQAGTRALATSRHAGEVAILDRVRPPGAQRVRCRGALRGSDHCSSATRNQRRHVEQEAQRGRRLCGTVLELGLSDSRILEHVYLTAFSRYPTETEKSSLLAALSKARANGRVQALGRHAVVAADQQRIFVQPLV